MSTLAGQVDGKQVVNSIDKQREPFYKRSSNDAMNKQVVALQSMK